jgi:tRNA (guanine-N(7)-)-methyltransferase subunit TRM82
MWFGHPTDIVLSADIKELQTLDLYDPLYSMPKNADVEHNPMDRDEGEASQEQPISKKQLGRLKSKKSLLAQTLEAEKLVEEDGGPQRKRRKSIHVKSSGDG